MRFETRAPWRNLYWGIFARVAMSGCVASIHGTFPPRCFQSDKVSCLYGFEYLITLGAGQAPPVCGERTFKAGTVGWLTCLQDTRVQPYHRTHPPKPASLSSSSLSSSNSSFAFRLGLFFFDNFLCCCSRMCVGLR